MKSPQFKVDQEVLYPVNDSGGSTYYPGTITFVNYDGTLQSLPLFSLTPYRSLLPFDIAAAVFALLLAVAGLYAAGPGEKESRAARSHGAIWFSGSRSRVPVASERLAPCQLMCLILVLYASERACYVPTPGLSLGPVSSAVDGFAQRG